MDYNVYIWRAMG